MKTILNKKYSKSVFPSTMLRTGIRVIRVPLILSLLLATCVKQSDKKPYIDALEKALTPTSTPATVSDITPPGNVTVFSATTGDTQISLSWTNPSTSDFAGVKILRKTGSYPVSSTDGTATIVYNSNGTSFADTGLTNGTQYFYTAYAYDAVGNYDSGVQATATATATAITLTLTMISVPANTTGFSMGYAGVTNATPVHTVASITAFSMAKYEVKYADWLTVKTWAGGQGYIFANAGVMGDGTGDTDQHPVTTISWRDAIVWCNAASQKDGLTPIYYTDAGFTTPLKTSTATASVNTTPGSEDNPYINWSANGYRLPTEAEWEYAARYIDGTSFMRGDAPSGWVDNNPANGAVDAAEFDAVGWYNNNSGSSTHVVGTRAGNALGLFDMSGNVWEWTHDWYGTYTTSAPYIDADSKGPISGSVRVLRGGCWINPSTNLRGALRFYNNPWLTLYSIGFRPLRRP